MSYGREFERRCIYSFFRESSLLNLITSARKIYLSHFGMSIWHNDPLNHTTAHEVALAWSLVFGLWSLVFGLWTRRRTLSRIQVNTLVRQSKTKGLRPKTCFESKRFLDYCPHFFVKFIVSLKSRSQMGTLPCSAGVSPWALVENHSPERD